MSPSADFLKKRLDFFNKVSSFLFIHSPKFCLKNRIFLLIALTAGCISLCAFPAIAGQWMIMGPYGGDIRAIAINPSSPTTVYAGTLGGVFRSTDGGANWAAVNTGLTHTQVMSLAINPSSPTTVYAGTWGGGVFRSTDGGANWAAVNTGLTTTYSFPISFV